LSLQPEKPTGNAECKAFLARKESETWESQKALVLL
jgi:hypothetical protein